MSKDIIHKLRSYIAELDLKYYGKNSLWVGSNQAIKILSGIILSVVFARLVTKDIFGSYNFLLSVLGLASIASIPGLNTSLLRSVSNGYDGVYKKSAKLSFAWSLIGLPFLVLAGAYYFYYANPVIGICLLLMAVLFPFQYAPNMWIPLLIGKKRFDRFAVLSIIKAILQTGAIITSIIISQGNLIVVFVTFLVVNGTFNTVYFFAQTKLIDNRKTDQSWKKSGYRLSLINFISIAYDYIDKIIIGILLGPALLAVYSVSIGITNHIRSGVKEIARTSYPKIFASKISFVKSRNKILLAFGATVIFTVILVAVMPFLIPFLYSQKYVDSIIFAQLNLITVPLHFMLIILTVFIIRIKREKELLVFRTVSIFITLGLYAVLIPLFSLYGAIIASIFFFVSNIVLISIFLQKSSV